MIEKFIGKTVKLQQFDGFSKYGILESHDNIFYYIRYKDGSVRGINKTTVKEISEKYMGGLE